MEIKVLEECGWLWAMLGLSLSYEQSVDEMSQVALKLLPRGGSHLKFLESVVVWLDVTAARYWWQQFDTYRVGITKQSGSTMHTILRRPLCQADFEGGVAPEILVALNGLIEKKDFRRVKANLPEGFLQRRVVCTNYKVLRHIIEQRHNHRLPEWQFFVRQVLAQVARPEFLRFPVVG